MNAIETLQKLINLEKRAKEVGNIHEAAAAAGRIQTLLTRHKLTMDDVEIASREAQEPIEWVGYTIGERRKRVMDLWRCVLADNIAKANTCAFVTRKADSLFYFVGRRSDREVCVTMLSYFCDLAGKMWIEAWDKEVKDMDTLLRKKYGQLMLDILRPEVSKAWLKKRRHFREGFFHGFGVTVAKRISEAHAQAEAAACTSTAIVHIDKDKELVKAELDGKTKQETLKSKMQRSEAGICAGSEAGEKIVLNPRVLGGN